MIEASQLLGLVMILTRSQPSASFALRPFVHIKSLEHHNIKLFFVNCSSIRYESVTSFVSIVGVILLNQLYMSLSLEFFYSKFSFRNQSKRGRETIKCKPRRTSKKGVLNHDYAVTTTTCWNS